MRWTYFVIHGHFLSLNRETVLSTQRRLLSMYALGARILHVVFLISYDIHAGQTECPPVRWTSPLPFNPVLLFRERSHIPVLMVPLIQQLFNRNLQKFFQSCYYFFSYFRDHPIWIFLGTASWFWYYFISNSQID